MSSIIPAIIPTSLAHLKEELGLFPFASRIQIDLVDGKFATPASWPYNTTDEVSDIDFGDKDVMIDLMVSEPQAAAEKWLELGANELVIHLESVDNLDDILKLKENYNFTLYISGNTDLDLFEYQKYFLQIEGIQLMGIDEIGSQGQTFSEFVVPNIRQIREMGWSGNIVIDGSVNEDTILALKEAGANDFVVGSAISATDNREASYYKLLTMITNEQ